MEDTFNEINVIETFMTRNTNHAQELHLKALQKYFFLQQKSNTHYSQISQNIIQPKLTTFCIL
jgi:hypothetical protein